MTFLERKNKTENNVGNNKLMIQMEKLAKTIVVESETTATNTHRAIESRITTLPKNKEGASVTQK